MPSGIKNKSKLYNYYNLSLNQSILDVFILQGIIDLEDAGRLKKYFKTNRDIENFLVKNRLVTLDTINKAYSIILKLPFIELKNVEIPVEALAVVPFKVAVKFGIIPFDINGSLLKIAVARPSELSVGFPVFLSKLKGTNLEIEIFVIGNEDFKNSIKQYQKKNKEIPLLKKGSLPVIYLRNRIIPKVYLQKLPKQFIEKYRVVVFDKNIVGDYLLACEKPDTSTAKKIIEYIHKENKINLEVFATSKNDIDFAVENYEQKQTFQIEPMQKNPVAVDKTASEKLFELKENTIKPIAGLVKNVFKDDSPRITFDSALGLGDDIKSGRKSLFQKRDQKPIIRKEEQLNPSPEKKDANFKSKIKKDYLQKLPRKFIEKYRVIVFDEDATGRFLIATDEPENELTKKAVEFIKKQHPVSVMKVSKEEFEDGMSVY